MGRKSHLSKEEGLVIQLGIESSRKISEIAKELNRSKSCISKEKKSTLIPIQPLAFIAISGQII